MRRVLSLTGLLLLSMVTGCTGHSAPAATPAPTSASATPTATAVSRPTTARAMIAALRHKQRTIVGVVIYNAKTDANHLLGRPKGYLSKGAWRDSRIPASDTVGYTLGDIDVGGGIEVFSDGEKAIERGGYIQDLGSVVANEYDFVCWHALLRVSGNLTPAQATGYRAQLAAVLHAPCSPVS